MTFQGPFNRQDLRHYGLTFMINEYSHQIAGLRKCNIAALSDFSRINPVRQPETPIKLNIMKQGDNKVLLFDPKRIPTSAVIRDLVLAS